AQERRSLAHLAPFDLMRLEGAMALRLGILFTIFAQTLSAESATHAALRQQAWSVLDTGLAHPKAAHRLEAVKALSLLSGDRHATKLAVRALKDDNSDVRAAAATTLGQLHVVSAIPDLRQALQDKDTSVVLAAAQALYW